jgi:hypothetical protein
LQVTGSNNIVNLAPTGAAAAGSSSAGAQQGGSEGQGAPAQSDFCGAETRVSTHTCNSLYPAITVAPDGKRMIVWHDTRDGNFEIYGKVLESEISPLDQEEIRRKAGQLDPITKERITEVSSCSGYSGGSGGPTSPSGLVLLDERCSSDATAGSGATHGIIARVAAGRLDVNAASQVAILTAGDGATNFAEMGAQPGYRVRIETGANAGKEFFIQELLSPGVLDLTFIPSAVSDNDFVFSVFRVDSSCPPTACEFRMSCSRGASMFPDVVSDGNGRYHVVWQDDVAEKGKFQLFYAQVANKAVGLKQGCDTVLANSNQGGFPEVDPAVGSVGIVVGGVTRYFQASGTPGQFFSYGNRLLPTPLPSRSGDASSRTGLHRLFKDFFQGGGKWTGTSLAGDRSAWEQQVVAAGNPPQTPPVIIPGGHPLADRGDFGDRFSFGNLAFMVQAPPDLSVLVRRIAIPVLFKCAPPAPAGQAQPRAQDLVEAPRRPLPPGFVDPVDVARLLASPRVRVDPSLPARFTLEGDDTGTIFTNLLVDGPAGDFSRIVFQKPDRSEYKFVVGQLACGPGPCALRVPPEAGFSDAPNRQYKVTLEVWRGSDYRKDPAQVESASMAGRLLIRKEFLFDPGENVATFSFKDGELRLPAGAICFITAEPEGGISFSSMGVGDGHVVWTTDGGGEFSQYYSQFTLPPVMGLNVPVYYEGRLVEPPPEDIDDPVEVSSDFNFPAGFALRQVVSGHAGIIGIDSHPITNNIIFSENYPNGSPNNFSSITQGGESAAWSTISGLRDEVMIHIVKQPVGGFEVGTLFCGSGVPGVVVKISPDGKSVENPWVTLPGETGLMRGALWLDYVGVFGNALLVATTSGSVWKITSGKVATKLADLGTHLEGLIVVPNNPAKYGPWAGKALAGAEAGGVFYTVAPDGTTASFSLGISPESIAIVEKGQNFYAAAYAQQAVFGSPPEPFANVVGDIVAAQEFPGVISLIKWTGTKFVTRVIAQIGHVEQIIFTTAGLGNIGETLGGCDNQYVMSVPFKMTTNPSNQHARLARDPDNNVWMAWHSDRTGANEIFVTKYVGECGVWSVPTMGGSETRLTSMGSSGGQAKFPAIAVDDEGEVHVAFMGNDTPDRRWEIFYAQTTGGGTQFLPPARVTTSPGDAMMPDIAVTRDGGAKRVHIVWHDSRFGDFEIMYATKVAGTWRSSGQGAVDTRITSANGDSLFPRMTADKDQNLRVVYHDARLGKDLAAIFMSNFSKLANKWLSSGQGSTDRLVSQGPKNSLNPDIDQDRTGGIAIAWHDDRHVLENPDQHEEVYATYCPKLGQAEAHFPPLTTNVETKLDVSFEVVDCVDFQPISLTNVPEVCLKVRSPGATFLRARNEDGRFDDWAQFKPTHDKDTTIVPWRLTCGNGLKQVCVQVQDATSVGFPVCNVVALAAKEAAFKVEFFSDVSLTRPLSKYRTWPISPEGEVFVKMTASEPQVLPPRFDVISRGSHLVFNQETLPLDAAGSSGSSGFSGASGTESSGVSGSEESVTSGASGVSATSSSSAANGIGSFTGSTAGSAFSAAAGQRFLGRFRLYRDDGLFHRDGLARVVVKPMAICDGGSDSTPGIIIDPCKAFSEALEPAVSGNGNPSGQPGGALPPPPTRPTPTISPFTLKFGDFPTFTNFPVGFGFDGNPPQHTGGTRGMYAVAQMFTLSTQAMLSSLSVKVTRGSLSGALTLVADVVRVPNAASAFEVASQASASIVDTSVPAGPATMATPATTMTFGANRLDPGQYALVLRTAEVGDVSHFFNVYIQNKNSLSSPVPGMFFVQFTQRAEFFTPPASGTIIPTYQGQTEMQLELSFVSP